METNDFSPELHVLAGTLRPRCVDQHLVVRWLRGVARTSSSLGHHKNLPTRTSSVPSMLVGVCLPLHLCTSHCLLSIQQGHGLRHVMSVRPSRRYMRSSAGALVHVSSTSKQNSHIRMFLLSLSLLAKLLCQLCNLNFVSLNRSQGSR